MEQKVQMAESMKIGQEAKIDMQSISLVKIALYVISGI